MTEKNVHNKLGKTWQLIGTRGPGAVRTQGQRQGVTSLFGKCLSLLAFYVMSHGLTPLAIAGSEEAGSGTLSPIVGAAAPLLDAPVVLTDAQRERAEQATLRSHLPVPLEVVPGASAAVPTSPPSAIAEGPVPRGKPIPNAPSDFVIFQNSQHAPSSSSEVNEPSVAQADNVVFYAGNWYAAVSTDHGATYNYIDPYSGPFAPVNGGFCCDQVTTYDPSRDAIFYLQQYIFDGTTGTQRINVDSNADGTFDCAYDLTPQNFGRPNGEWLDFPDLVLGANSLYHTSNIFNAAGSFTSSVIARYSLDEMAACGGIGFSYLVKTDVGSLRATHGAGTTMYWGTHLNTSSLRIYEWAEGSGTISNYDRTVTSWANGGSVCPGPDGRDFTSFGDGRILGSYASGGVIGFMWRSAQHGSFPRPYVKIARFNEGTKNLIDEPEVWSSDICWSYPSVGVNAAGELGGTILAGSATSNMQCQAWIADSVNGGTIAPLENLTVTAGTQGPVGNRSGDYLTARGHHNYATNTWAGTCFAYQAAGTRPHFAWWGRESNGPQIEVTSPNGGEVWTVGTSETITWTEENLPATDNIFIWLNDIGGTGYNQIAGPIPVGLESSAVTVPDIVTTQGSIFLGSWTGQGYSDTDSSDGVFSVVPCSGCGCPQ